MKKKLKMRCKRSFALLLALAMCLGTTPGIAFASEDVAVESSDSSSSDNSTDSGSDTGSDSGTDSGSDTGSDSGTDSGSDTGSDSGTDSGSDTGSDTGNDSSSNSESDTGSDSNGPDGSENNGGSADSGSGSAENTDKTSDTDSTTDNDSTDDTADDGADNSGTSADGTINADGGNVADSQGNTENAESGSDSMDNADSADPDSLMADTSTDGDGGNVLDVTDGSDDLGSYNVSLSEEVVLGEMQFSVLNVSKAASSDAQIRSLDDDVPVEDASSADDTASEMETDPAASGKAKAWDITQTERPDATKDVEYGIGTDEDHKLPVLDTDWEIFYDKENDVYKVTFNISGKADDEYQVIDLTKALEMLGRYADSGKRELDKAINALEKPVKGDAGEEPKMEDVGKEPVFEAPEMPTMPDEPVKPSEPGKPKDLDENLEIAYSEILESVPRDGAGEPSGDFDYAAVIAEKTGLSKDDPFVKESAERMYDQAMVDWCMSSWSKWEADGHPYVSYFGDPDTMLYYGCGISVKWPDGYCEGTPVLKKPAPKYTVDENSQAYKDYQDGLREYNTELDAYNKARKEYDKALEAYKTQYGEGSEKYEAYQKELDEYKKRYEEAKRRYEAEKAEYDARLVEIEKRYAEDEAEYAAAVAALKAEFDRQIGANVYEPGDTKKFELYLTSDSKHTYKYQTGSFVLATPDWLTGDKDGITGFDGQIIPDHYVDHAKYYITVRSEPIQKLLEEAGVDEYDRFNGTFTNYSKTEIKAILANYEGETIAERLNSYILAFYGNKYATIEELVANNPDARAELTKTETSGNKWLNLGEGYFPVNAHTETVKYDTFYKNLFSFAFGDPTDIDKVLGEGALNPGTDRFEYDNTSWTDNGYQLALAYYMEHKEIWQSTDAYFSALLDGGLSAEKATWASLMMAVNIDGELTGNDWQNTLWPWYSSIKLERMDIDFSLTKKDSETGETISPENGSSETGFQVYYIDKVKNEDGTVTTVNMYCTQVTGEDGMISYTFRPERSTVWTESGKLNIDYAMMKDIVYYLQEVAAPDGYELDTNVYIVMSEEDYGKLSDEDKAALEGTFNKFLDMEISNGGLTAKADFINVKIVTPENPGTPTTPSTPSRPRRDRDTTIPNEPTPLADIPEAPVPLASIPDEDVPLAVLLDEDVPLASVPKTGDISSLWFALLALSGIGLLGMAAINGKKSKESASNG